MEPCWEPSAFCVLKVKKGFKKTFIKNFKGKVVEVEEVLRFPKRKVLHLVAVCPTQRRDGERGQAFR